MKYPFKSHAKSLRQLCEYCPIGAFLLHLKRICQKETNSDFFCDKKSLPHMQQEKNAISWHTHDFIYTRCILVFPFNAKQKKKCVIWLSLDWP